MEYELEEGKGRVKERANIPVMQWICWKRKRERWSGTWWRTT